MSSWFFVKDGQRNGPIGRAELDARIAEGAVDTGTLVWRTGMAAWAPAGSVPELGLPPPVPPPPLPPSPVDTGRTDEEAGLRAWAAERAQERTRKELAEARVASGLDYAGFWVRFAARFIDGVILGGASLLVEQVVAMLWFDGVVPMPPDDWANWFRMLAITAPVNLVIVLAYSVYFIRRHEATPGKRMLGLRVVRADGSRLGAGRVIGRYFAEQLSGLVFLAGYVMAAFDEEKRTLHDLMCDTRVVRGERDEEDDATRG